MIQEELFLDESYLEESLETKISKFCITNSLQFRFIQNNLFWFSENEKKPELGNFTRRDCYEIISSTFIGLEETLILSGFKNIVPRRNGNCYIFIDT